MPASETFQKVQEVLVDALGVDEEEVTADATLVGDLGAESIDFLDIVFRLEKTFDIKIPRGELFPENLTASHPGAVVNGIVTPVGLAALRERLPHVDIDKFSKNPKQENLSDLFTVHAICKFLDRKLADTKAA